MIKNKIESEWINTVLKKGTIADKLAAHTLLIHDTKNWSSLDTLINLVDPRKCRRQCIMAMSTLKELFLESLNLSRKECQITGEDDKKKVRFYYTRFIDQLSLVAFDDLEETRKKAIWIFSELLTKHSENKDYILEKLVDKIGDKIPKLATTAGHLIEKAVNHERDDIRFKTIKYIQRFLKRPNITSQARYYSIALLTRIKLIRGNYDMANHLMETYLELYTTLTKEKNIESRLMSVILVGIHRAYPYSKLSNDTFEQHLQTLYTLVHHVNFRMGVVAMVLIKNIVTKRAQLLKTPIEDRFYNLIFGQLIRPELHTCSRQQAFANLLQNVINDDTCLKRKEAFIKRILLVALNSGPELAQILLSTITKIKGFSTNLTALAQEEEKNDGLKRKKPLNVSNGLSHSKVDAGNEQGSIVKVVNDPRDETSEDDDDDDDNGGAGFSWVHKKRKFSDRSDPLARNARAANPEHLNELHLLRQYCDPIVSELARVIAGEIPLKNAPNPTLAPPKSKPTNEATKSNRKFKPRGIEVA